MKSRFFEPHWGWVIWEFGELKITVSDWGRGEEESDFWKSEIYFLSSIKLFKLKTEEINNMNLLYCYLEFQLIELREIGGIHL